MSIVFTNPDVAAKYVALRSKDGIVDVPCGPRKPGDKKTGYHGLLSGITLEAADRSFKFGSGILDLKKPDGKGAKPATLPEIKE